MDSTSYTICVANSWPNEGQGPILLALFTKCLEGSGALLGEVLYLRVHLRYLPL